MGVQIAGGATARHRAHAVAVLQGAAQPPIDHPGGTPGADGLTGAFEPHLAGGITGQILAFGLGEQRTQMQGRGAPLHIEVHHHRGVLAVRAGPVKCFV
jgi:hypothetical protein